MGFQLIINAAPIAKGRPKFARMGNFVRAYTPKQTVTYENIVKAAVMEKMAVERLSMSFGPLRVELHFLMPIPQSWSGKKKARAEMGEIAPTTKPDADNLAKAVLDAMNKLLFHDDSQIVELLIVKRYGNSPQTLIKVAPLDMKPAA